MSVAAVDLDTAVNAFTAVIGPAAPADWSTPGTGTRNGRETAAHIGDCLVSYAGQLTARAKARFVCFELVVEESANTAQVLEFVTAGTGILSAVVRSVAPEVRAYHPTGMSDPEGFAAMGCAELLVHGEDIARGLGLTLDPPRDLCARVLARLFPDVVVGADAWATLLWATDRIELPGLEKQVGWRWRGAPLGE